MRLIGSVCALFAILVASVGHAEEGMWTFNHFPSDQVEKAYGFKPDQAWLDHFRLSTLRIPGHCSASFVSPHGLVLTNHHCVKECIETSSKQKPDIEAAGFYAAASDAELKCDGLELDQSLAITDVTERLNASVAGKEGSALVTAYLAERQNVIKECSAGEADIRCEIVDLHGGAMFNLYRNRLYRDVRIVFIPERTMADFGGDIDDFHFPHTSLDIAFLRVYADGKPLDTAANHLKPSIADVQTGDVTFAAGSPGFTFRLDTQARLEFRRDVELPRDIFYDLELRGLQTEFAAVDQDHASSAAGSLAALEGMVKYNRGRYAALAGPNIIRLRAQFERDLREKIAEDPQLQARFGETWGKIRDILDDFRNWRDRYEYTAGKHAFQSELFDLARRLLRQAAETPTKPAPDAQSVDKPAPAAQAAVKPAPAPAALVVGKPAPAPQPVNTPVQEGQASNKSAPAAQSLAKPARKVQAVSRPPRERSGDNKVPDLRSTMKGTAAAATFDPELEKLRFAFSMAQLRDALGPDDALVKKVLGRKSPRQRAAELIDGTALNDADFVKGLVDGAPDAINNSTDPMIVFARSVDADINAMEATYAHDFQQPLARDLNLVAQAAFAVYGTAIDPIASYSPRITYGAVTGYRAGGQKIVPITRFGALFDRATDADPYLLPANWLAAKASLNMQQSLNFVTTNDVIGGNSGSPVINPAGEIIGVLFDINYQALGGYFVYDPTVNRAIGVSVGAMREALSKVYHADALVAELAE
jgi:hypothetical protein